MRRVILVTGRPGVGKTTVLLRAVEMLKAKGYKIGGIITREIREHNMRVGFEIQDIYTGKKGWLAHVNQPTGPQVSRYRVNLEDLDDVGASAIFDAVKNADIVIIDEIGPMELFSKTFKDAVTYAVESGKPVVGTIHFRARDPLINMLKTSQDTEILEVTLANRTHLHKLIVNKVVQFMQRLS